MVLARPTYLYLLALVPVAAIAYAFAARRRKIDARRLGDPALIARLGNSVSVPSRRWKMALCLLALTAQVIALARPRWGTELQVDSRRGVQVMAVLDVSASMLAEDVKPSRLARAKLLLEEFMDELGGSQLGLVLFAGAAFVQAPLTADLNTVRGLLRAAGPDSVSRAGTALDEAVRVALGGFREDIETHRVMLLLTDGEAHEGDPLTAARAAAAAGVTIHAVGFGTTQGEPIPIRDANGALLSYKTDARGDTVLSRLNETLLQEMAGATGGRFFRAAAANDAVSAIRDAIGALEGGELQARPEILGVERFPWFAGLALLALTAEFLLPDRTTRRLRLRPEPLLLLVCCATSLIGCVSQPMARNNTGNEYFLEGQYRDALTLYRQAQAAGPDRAEPYYNAANVYIREAQLVAAQAQAREAVARAEPNLAAMTWYNLGNAYFEAEAWSDAAACYKEALRLYPRDQDAKHNLELALQRVETEAQGPGLDGQTHANEQYAEPDDRRPSEEGRPTEESPSASSQGEVPATDEPSEEMQPGQGMSREQALQLLRALASHSDTLLRRLQDGLQTPAAPPTEDW